MASVRINKYDNLKGFAILLIVLGHLPSMITGRIDHKIVYLIHLPIFFFVAGYFSKTTPDQPLKIFKRLVIPYIIFCILWDIYLVFIIKTAPYGAIFLYPGFGLWFLISLILMKTALFVFDDRKYPISVAIILAILTGFIDIPSGILGVTRAFTYFPAFLVGYKYNSLSLKYEKYKPIFTDKKYNLIFLALLLILGVILTGYTSPRLILQESYHNHFIRKAFLRLIVIIVGVSFALVFNNLMTNKNCFLTKFGKNSMAVYLLHPYLLKYVLAPFIKANFNKGILGLIIVITVAFIITFVLSRDVFTNLINKMIDFIYDRIIVENG